MTPYVEVSHLASSTSFYAAILQPLGLQYISPLEERGSRSKLVTTAGFGLDERRIVLELHQSTNPLKPPRLSSLVVGSPSRSSVSAVHACWKRAEPRPLSGLREKREFDEHLSDLEAAKEGPWQSKSSSGFPITRTILYDLDGNKIEVLHNPNQRDHTSPRVIDWTYDVGSASSKSGRISLRKNSTGNSNSLNLLRSNTMPSSHYESAFGGGRPPSVTTASKAAESIMEDSTSPRHSSRQGGLSTTTVVSALLGAATGAALTYGFLTSGSKEPVQSEVEKQRHPAMPPRRATFSEKAVNPHRQSYPEHDGAAPMNDYQDYHTPRQITYPDFKTLSLKADEYADGDENVDYGKPWMNSSSRFLTQGPANPSVTHKSRPSSVVRPVDEEHETRSHYSPRPADGSHDRRNRHPRPPSTTRLADDSFDSRSRHSARFNGGRSATVRARSEGPSSKTAQGGQSREEFDDRRSYAPSSRRSVTGDGATKSRGSRSHRGSVYDEGVYEAHVSAHSRHASSRTQQNEYEYYGREKSSRSRAPSQVSTSTVRERSRDTARAPSHAPSRISARRVPLPMSGVEGSQSGWEPRNVPLPMSGVGSSHAEWDDDLESLAPSDSISCVGSKPHSRRSRRQRS